MIKVGQIYRPVDKRRDGRRIRVVKTFVGLSVTGWKEFFALVESRHVGQRKWKPAPPIRLDRLESRHYKLVKGC